MWVIKKIMFENKFIIFIEKVEWILFSICCFCFNGDILMGKKIKIEGKVIRYNDIGVEI